MQELAFGLLTELKYLDTRFPRVAEQHMKRIREGLKAKGFEAAGPEIGQALRDRDRASHRDERSTASKKSSGRRDLDDADERPAKRRTGRCGRAFFGVCTPLLTYLYVTRS